MILKKIGERVIYQNIGKAALQNYPQHKVLVVQTISPPQIVPQQLQLKRHLPVLPPHKKNPPCPLHPILH